MSISTTGTDVTPGPSEVRCGSESPPYRLAVVAAPDDRDTAVAILGEVLGLNSIDARTRLKHVPAVWPDLFSATSAMEAARRLQALGATASALPASAVPDFRSAGTLHHVRCQEDGFVIMSITGEPERTIAWSDLAILSVADVAGLRQEMAPAIPDGVFRHAAGTTGASAAEVHGLEMWLITVSPVQVFRIDAELMNYEYLADRLSLSTTANFAQFVRDVHRFAIRLTLTPSAQAYVTERSAAPHTMPSTAAHRDAVTAFWVAQRDAADPETDSDSTSQSRRQTEQL